MMVDELVYGLEEADGFVDKVCELEMEVVVIFHDTGGLVKKAALAVKKAELDFVVLLEKIVRVQMVVVVQGHIWGREHSYCVGLLVVVVEELYDWEVVRKHQLQHNYEKLNLSHWKKYWVCYHCWPIERR